MNKPGTGTAFEIAHVRVCELIRRFERYACGKCAALDRQIDALVYELYGLTEAEIALVEGAA